MRASAWIQPTLRRCVLPTVLVIGGVTLLQMSHARSAHDAAGELVESAVLGDGFLRAHDAIQSIAFMDESRIAAITRSGTLYVWDVTKRKEVHRQTVFTTTPENALRGSDGQAAVMISGDEIVVVRPSIGKTIRLRTTYAVPPMAVSWDGNLVAACELHKIGLWNLQSGQHADVDLKRPVYPAALGFDGLGRLTAVDDGGVRRLSADGVISDVPLDFQGMHIRSAALDRQAETLATILIPFEASKRGNTGVSPASVSPAKQMVAVFNLLAKEKMWQTRTRPVFVRSTELSAAGTVVAIVYWDGLVQLYDTSTARSLGEIATGYRYPRVTFSPDGQMLAVAIDSAIGVWSIDNLKSTVPIEGHSALAYPSASQDGRILITASEDFSVRLWNLVGAQEVARFLPAKNLLAPTAAVSPDGSLFAWSGDQDEHVEVWSSAPVEKTGTIAVGREPHQLTGLSVDNSGRVAILTHSLAGGGELILATAKSGSIEKRIPLGDFLPSRLRVSSDWKHAVYASADNESHFYYRCLQTGDLLKQWEPSSSPYARTFYDDGGDLITCIEHSARKHLTITKWTLAGMQRFRGDIDLQDDVSSIFWESVSAASAQGFRLALVDSEAIYLWPDVRNKARCVLFCREWDIRELSFADEKTLVAASANGLLRILRFSPP